MSRVHRVQSGARTAVHRTRARVELRRRRLWPGLLPPPWRQCEVALEDRFAQLYRRHRRPAP